MAKAYKYMFDTRFDEQEEEEPLVQEDVSEQSFEGVPSISELLSTLQNADVEEVLLDEIQKIEEENDGALELEQKTPDSSEKEQGQGQKQAANFSQTFEKIQEQTSSLNIELAESCEKIERLKEEMLEKEAQIKKLEQEVFNLKEELKQKGECLTQEQAETAKQKSFQEGKEQGAREAKEATWQEAMASIEKQNSDLLARIDGTLKEIFEQSEELNQRAFETSVNFSKALSRKILPALSEENALQEIEYLLEKSFEFLKEEPKISLHINPFLADKIKPIVKEIVKKEAYVGKVAVLRDDNIAIGDCLVEWKNGGLERKIEEVLEQAETLLTQYLQTNTLSLKEQ